MKKILTLLLAVLMLLSSFGAFAEEDTVPVEVPPFTFRGGLTWGLTLDEVIAIEGAEPVSTEEYSYHITKAVFENRPLSSYTCTITYWFVDGGLQQSQVLLEEGWTYSILNHPVIIKELSPSMEAVYGAPLDIENADERFVSAYNALCMGKRPNAYVVITIDPFSRTLYRLWQPAQDSAIAIAAHDEALFLHYLNIDIDWDAAINELPPEVIPINTTGL